MTDLRLAMRVLGRQPGTSLLAVVALALGIGLTTTMFSIVNGAILRGLPFEDGDRIYHLARLKLLEGATDEDEAATLHDFADWRERQRTFEDLAAFHSGTANVVGPDGTPERYRGSWVTANTFRLLRVTPALGRDFVDADGRPGAERVVIIGDRVWRERFGGHPSAIGQSLRVNGTPMTVVGVMPPRFAFPATQELWVALPVDTVGAPRADSTRVSVIGRLPRDRAVDQAEAEMATIAAQIAADHPDTNTGFGVVIRTYIEEFLGAQTIAALTTMLVAVLGVLLIACVNVANLVLARAVQRSKELAVRTAIGASRFRVVRQMLVEVLVLAVLGAGAGLALAAAGVELFNRAIVDTDPPFFIDIRIDGIVLLFVTGVTVLAALASGVVPAVRASRNDLMTILSDEGRGTSSLRVSRFSRGLVVAEMALSFGLLVMSVLVIQSILNIARVDFGFAMADVWTGRVVLPREEYPDAERQRQFADALVARAAAVPGVVSAALAVGVPPGAPRDDIKLPGAVYENERGYPQARGNFVSPGYFNVLRVGVLQGRDFSLADRVDAERVAIVNESFARRFFPDGALGRRFARARGEGDAQEWRTIVGIVPDLGMGDVDNGRVPEAFYLPLAQAPASSVALLLHASGPPLELTNAVRQAVREIDANLPVFGVTTIQDSVQQRTWAFRVFGSLFMAFGFAALFLATVGLYGVMAFSVSRRTQEIGVRMAVGATARDVSWQVLRQGLWPIGLGTALGLGLAAGLTTAMQLLLFRVSPYDPLTYVAVALILMATGILACLVPARRAAAVDPMHALRYQ
ncbi:MAG: ABC transporter permease [Acidobacteriota bacterium]